MIIRPEGSGGEVEVQRVLQNRQEDLEKEMQSHKPEEAEIQKRMEVVVNRFGKVFQGIGAYKGDKVRIHLKDGVRPVIQPNRRIPLLLVQPLKDHINELLEEGPLQEEEEGTWISNLIITSKK